MARATLVKRPNGGQRRAAGGRPKALPPRCPSVVLSGAGRVRTLPGWGQEQQKVCFLFDVI